MVPLPEELTQQADRALREAVGGSDHHRADDLGIVAEHVARLRENAEHELKSLDA